MVRGENISRPPHTGGRLFLSAAMAIPAAAMGALTLWFERQLGPLPVMALTRDRCEPVSQRSAPQLRQQGGPDDRHLPDQRLDDQVDVAPA